MRPDDLDQERDDLNEGVLRSIVRSIFLRNRSRWKSQEEPEPAEEHLDLDED